MKRKDTTKSQLPEETEKRLHQEVLALTEKLEQERKQRDRRDAKWNVPMLAFLGLLTIACIVTGNWLGIVFNLSTAMWIAMSWTKDKHINFLRYMIDFQFGIRDLEVSEIERSMKQQPVIKGAK